MKAVINIAVHILRLFPTISDMLFPSCHLFMAFFSFDYFAAKVANKMQLTKFLRRFFSFVRKKGNIVSIIECNLLDIYLEVCVFFRTFAA